MLSPKWVVTSRENGSPFKSKRLSSNAIRQYPPGCGVPDKEAAATSLKSDRALHVMRSGLLVKRDFPPGCGPQASSFVPKSISSSGRLNHVSFSNLENQKRVSGFVERTLANPCLSKNSTALEATVMADMKKGCKQIVSGSSGKLSRQELSRERVQKLLKSFAEVLAQISEDCETSNKRNIHIDAAMFLKARGHWLNVERRLGDIPGIKIGDRFQFRAELNMIGLHRQFNCGIDHMKREGVILATSVVATANYANVMKSSDELVYVGEGGGPCFLSSKKESVVKDQEMKQGNLALKNSMEHRTPVRVIRHFKLERPYVYDGLFTVEDYWPEKDKVGKLVFKFLLRRIPGQLELIKEMRSKPTR